MNRRVMDMMMRRARRDGRNPYGSAGGYVSSRRGRDGLMMDDMRRYNQDPSAYNLGDMTRQNREIEHDPYMPYDYARGGSQGGRGSDSRGGRDRAGRDYERGYSNRDYGTGQPYAGVDDFYEQNDMARGRRDGHYGMQGQMYYPIEAMGTFNGYYGMPEQDYARGGRRGYGYDYDYAGDYGENLTMQELERWNKKLMQEVEEKDKQFFSKENVKKKAQEMGVKFDKFNEEEFYLTALMMYTDYCKTLGTANMDTYLRLAKDWLEDKDVSVKGGEKLAVYHDCIVQGDD